jgi:predicted membrane-bound dolichyl-phosphate-mannose-protein mannosyltransferase
MDAIYILIGCLVGIFVLVAVPIIKDYYHLKNWLEVHAPMTWETYNRLGK